MEWRKVEGYERYLVSDQGHVKVSLTDKHLKRQVDAGGYFHVQLAATRQKPNRYRAVHRLVLEAFSGPCPEGLEACHNDGNKLNNRLDNLRWDTHRSNCIDRELHKIVDAIYGT